MIGIWQGYDRCTAGRKPPLPKAPRNPGQDKAPAHLTVCGGFMCRCKGYRLAADSARYDATPSAVGFIPFFPLFQPAGHTSPCFSVN